MINDYYSDMGEEENAPYINQIPNEDIFLFGPGVDENGNPYIILLQNNYIETKPTLECRLSLTEPKILSSTIQLNNDLIEWVKNSVILNLNKINSYLFETFIDPNGLLYGVRNKITLVLSFPDYSKLIIGD